MVLLKVLKLWRISLLVSLYPLIAWCDNIIEQKETKAKKCVYVNCEISS